MTGARQALAAAAVTFALATTGPAPGAGAASGAARAAAGPAAVTLTLASQTPWVGPGQDFQLRLGLSPSTTPDGSLTVTVFSAVPNRIEFTRTLSNRIGEAVLTRPLTVPLTTLAPDAAGARTIVIPIQDPTKARDRARLYLSRSGVYPVRVEYRRDANADPVPLVTHLVYMSGPVSGDKLQVAWILPIHATPRPAPDGTESLSSQQSDRLATLATALKANRGVPLVLQPNPDTIAALAASEQQQDRNTLAILARPVPGNQVVAGTYVPLALPGMLAAGLADDATLQLTRGNDELAAALSIRPDGRTWVEEGPIDQASAAYLRGAQVDRLVVPEGALSPNPFPVTLAQPFSLSIRPDSSARAVAADAGLADHFLQANDPVLVAHQLLADLTVLYLDRPSLTRGVVIATPRAWRPDSSFLRVFLDAMSKSPVLSGSTLDRLFTTVPPAMLGRNQPMIRTLVPDGRTAFDAATFPVESLQAARRRLDGLGSALTADNPLYGQLERMLLTAESSDFVVLRERQTEVDLVNRKINDQLALLHLPSARNITMTARVGKLPITIESAAPYPVRVVLRLQSDKLSFPASGSRGGATTTIDLHRGNNPVLFSVQARTSGSFPLHISLVSPDGRLVLTATSFTVQSTALSGMGLFLSIGAGLFLAGWWGRHALRGRRSRHLRLQAATAST